MKRPLVVDKNLAIFLDLLETRVVDPRPPRNSSSSPVDLWMVVERMDQSQCIICGDGKRIGRSRKRRSAEGGPSANRINFLMKAQTMETNLKTKQTRPNCGRQSETNLRKKCPPHWANWFGPSSSWLCRWCVRPWLSRVPESLLFSWDGAPLTNPSGRWCFGFGERKS